MTKAEKLFIDLRPMRINEDHKLTARLLGAETNGSCSRWEEFIITQEIKMSIGRPVLLTKMIFRGYAVYTTRDTDTTKFAQAIAAYERLIDDAVKSETHLRKEATDMIVNLIGHSDD